MFHAADKSIAEEVYRNFSNLIFENREMEVVHNPYDQEVREVTAIETGDIQQLKKSWAENYTGKLGTLAKNELRNAKNLGIVIVTLASRAAIRGGISPETAFSMSDSYIQKIEELTDTENVYSLMRNCELCYTQMVREYRDSQDGKRKEQRNPLVNKCKEYIFSHLHEKISIQIIGQELGMNPNYLSECFKQYEGVTMKQFILNEKIKLAKNLLIYSQYSYIEIASYLGFSSQSHLGKIFKKATGSTLGQYRAEYGVKTFRKSDIEDSFIKNQKN